MFSRAASGVPYFVASITDATHLELSSVYAGASASSVAYSITRDFTSVHDFPLMSAGDIDTPTIYNRLVQQLETLFGTATLGASSVVVTDASGNLITDAGLTYNTTTNALTVGGTLTVSGAGLIANGSAGAYQLDIGATGLTQASYGVVSVGGTNGGMLKFASGTTARGQMYGNSGGIALDTLAAQPIGFYTNSLEQLRIPHTASADRYATITGGVSGSGTNATIGVSGGGLTITPTITASSLAGTGTRAVVVDANGVMSAP